MFFVKRKRIVSGCMMGLGFGIILVLFLPLTAWLCIIGVGLIIGGICYLCGK